METSDYKVELDHDSIDMILWRVRKENLTPSEVIRQAIHGRAPEAPLNYYLVQRGDWLAKISTKLYGHTGYWEHIAEINGIDKPYRLHAGEKILVPAHPATRAILPWMFSDDVPRFYYGYGKLYPRTSKWAGIPHPGVDYSFGLGSLVLCPTDGQVIMTQEDPGGYGKYVIVRAHHGRSGALIHFLFGHLDEILVEPGMIARQGSVLGLEGATGAAGKTPHVHFEVKKSLQFALYPHLRRDPKLLDTLFINPHLLKDMFFGPLSTSVIGNIGNKTVLF
jgi:murein DD-endopeptidase MepM/ murein hydrolase activator NlpD